MEKARSSIKEAGNEMLLNKDSLKRETLIQIIFSTNNKEAIKNQGLKESLTFMELINKNSNNLSSKDKEELEKLHQVFIEALHKYKTNQKLNVLELSLLKSVKIIKNSGLINNKNCGSLREQLIGKMVELITLKVFDLKAYKIDEPDDGVDGVDKFNKKWDVKTIQRHFNYRESYSSLNLLERQKQNHDRGYSKADYFILTSFNIKTLTLEIIDVVPVGEKLFNNLIEVNSIKGKGFNFNQKVDGQKFKNTYTFTC